MKFWKCVLARTFLRRKTGHPEGPDPVSTLIDLTTFTTVSRSMSLSVLEPFVFGNWPLSEGHWSCSNFSCTAGSVVSATFDESNKARLARPMKPLDINTSARLALSGVASERSRSAGRHAMYSSPVAIYLS